MTEHLSQTEQAQLEEYSVNIIGTTFQRRFAVESQLGKGGAGTVYLCTDLHLRRKVALKILQEEFLDSPDKLDRFQREAQALNSLSHPNVVSIYAFGVTGDWQPYLVMPYIEGRSLDSILDEGLLERRRAIAILLMICDALIHIHENGIIHRDLKPGNVMIYHDEQNREIAQIVDFGIAKPTKHSDADIQKITSTGEVFGSPFYMSPEQWRAEEVSFTSDVYSLGCLIYEVITGKVPRTVEELLDLMIDKKDLPLAPMNAANPEIAVSSQMNQLVNKAMQIDPVTRYQTISELKSDLLKTPEAIESGNSDTISINAYNSEQRLVQNAQKDKHSFFWKKLWPVPLAMLILTVIAFTFFKHNSFDSASKPHQASASIDQQTKTQSFSSPNKYSQRAIARLEELGQQQERSGNLDKAISYYEAALANRQLKKSRDWNLEGHANFHIAQLNEQHFQSTKPQLCLNNAEKYYQQAILCFKSSKNLEPKYIVLSEYNLALLLNGRGKTDQQFLLYKDALTFGLDSFLPGDPAFELIVKGMEKVASTYKEKNENEAARIAYELSRKARIEFKKRSTR